MGLRGILIRSIPSVVIWSGIIPLGLPFGVALENQPQEDLHFKATLIQVSPMPLMVPNKCKSPTQPWFLGGNYHEICEYPIFSQMHMGITWTCRCHVPFRLNLPSTITAERWGNVCSSIQHVGSIFCVILIPFWGSGSLKSLGPKKSFEQGQRDMLGSGSKQNATQKLSETHQALKLDWETRIPQDTLCTQFKERFLSDLSLALVKASGLTMSMG